MYLRKAVEFLIVYCILYVQHAACRMQGATALALRMSGVDACVRDDNHVLCNLYPFSMFAFKIHSKKTSLSV